MGVHKESLSDLHRILGVNISWFLVNKQFTITDLEKNTGIYRTRLSRILTGRQELTLSEIQKIAYFLDVEVEELFHIDKEDF